VKSIAELVVELESRKRQLVKLQARRDALAREMSKLDREIAAIGGAAPAAVRILAPAPAAKGKIPSRRRSVGGKPLIDYIKEVLAGKDKGMRVREIATAVVKAGYQTVSRDFYGIVASTVRDKTFKRIRRGVYRLA
jgi:hypothetical protein